VLPSPTWIFSDAHLGFATPGVQRDLVEFWFEWKSVIPRSSFRVLAALADLRDAGIPVLMVAGNHDCWGGDVLRSDVGIDYIVGPWTGDVAGWHSRIEHGDGLRPREDRRYRALRTVLRNRLAIRAFRWLHPDLATPLATGSSHASRTHSARDGGRGLQEAAARALASDRSLELLVYGHSHVPTLERIGGAVYGNAGSWLDAPTYIEVTPTRVALRRWNGSTEGSYLHTLDRVAEKSLAEL
jgi:UDP-2,3-diacylglucosamine hydrolase